MSKGPPMPNLPRVMLRAPLRSPGAGSSGFPFAKLEPMHEARFANKIAPPLQRAKEI
jgi:hypothetical protein